MSNSWSPAIIPGLDPGDVGRVLVHFPEAVVMSDFVCADCKVVKPVQREGGTGYASLPDGSRICYQCCAVRDAELMRTDGKAVLYLSVDHDSLKDAGVSHEHNTRNGIYPRNYGWILTNWPGTLRLIPFRVRKGLVGSKANQVAKIGNSVPPQLAEALVRANW